MTPRQLQLLHIAKHKVFAKDDASYRLLLKNVAGVQTSKDLTNNAFEDVMAVLESSGFIDQVHGQGYWQRKAGTGSRDRMVHKIHALAAESRYQLPALCQRFSAHRTDAPEHLYPREAWNLIEMLKASAEREAQREPDASARQDPAFDQENYIPF